MRLCNSCKKTLPFSKFYKDPTQKCGYKSFCKRCVYLTYNRPQLYKRYGLSPTDIEALIKKQDGKCFICQVTFIRDKAKGNRQAHLDHDHETGKIRGVLCSNCNRAIGLLKDDVDVLARAIIYLRKPVKEDTLEMMPLEISRELRRFFGTLLDYSAFENTPEEQILLTKLN